MATDARPRESPARGARLLAAGLLPSSAVRFSLRLCIVVHQGLLIGAALASPAPVAAPYLALALLFGLGGLVLPPGQVPLSSPIFIVVQVTLSVPAAIVALALSARQFEPAATTLPAMDATVLVESVALLCILVRVSWTRPWQQLQSVFRAPHIDPPAPAVAAIGLGLVAALCIVRPSVASLLPLAAVLVTLGLWAVHVRTDTVTRAYASLDPALRVLLAAWIAADYTRHVLRRLTRTAAAAGPQLLLGDPYDPWAWALRNDQSQLQWLREGLTYACLMWLSYVTSSRAAGARTEAAAGQPSVPPPLPLAPPSTGVDDGDSDGDDRRMPRAQGVTAGDGGATTNGIGERRSLSAPSLAGDAASAAARRDGECLTHWRRAWHAAHGGALLLVSWSWLQPCAASVVLLACGAHALLGSARWPYSPVRAWSASRPLPSVRFMSSARARTQAGSLPTTSRRVLPFSALWLLRARGIVWLPAALLVAVCWIAGQYGMALMCAHVRNYAAQTDSAVARLGMGCEPPLRLLSGRIEAAAPLEVRVALAFAVQLMMCTLLAVCCRVHLSATGRLEALHRIAITDGLPGQRNTAAMAAAAAAATTTMVETPTRPPLCPPCCASASSSSCGGGAHTASSGSVGDRSTRSMPPSPHARAADDERLARLRRYLHLGWAEGRSRRGRSLGRWWRCAALEQPARHARALVTRAVTAVVELWLCHAHPVAVVGLTLLAGVSRCSLVRVGWLFLFLAYHADAVQSSSRRRTSLMWHHLAAVYGALTAATAALGVTLVQPSAGQGFSGWPEMVGVWRVASTLSAEGLRRASAEVGWPLCMLVVHTLQGAMIRARVGWRAIARRRWRQIRRTHLPRLAARLESDRAVRVRRLLRRLLASPLAHTWLAYAWLLLASLATPVHAVGLLCLAFLVACLLIEQSYTEARRRAHLQRPLWQLLCGLLLASLGLRYALRIPFIAQTLLASGGLLGPRCDAHNATSVTLCVAVLQDLGMVGGDDTYQLGASALLAALCMHRVRACRDAAASPGGALPGATRTNLRAWVGRKLLGRGRRVSQAHKRHRKRAKRLLYSLLQLERLLTLAVLLGGFACGLTPPVSVLRFIYLLTAMIGCFGVLAKGVWLPLGQISAVGLLCQYAFQSLLLTHFYPVRGCDGPMPSSACDAQWAGLQSADAGTELPSLLISYVTLLILTLLQRQLQLRIRAACDDGLRLVRARMLADKARKQQALDRDEPRGDGGGAGGGGAGGGGVGGGGAGSDACDASPAARMSAAALSQGRATIRISAVELVPAAAQDSGSSSAIVLADACVRVRQSVDGDVPASNDPMAVASSADDARTAAAATSPAGRPTLHLLAGLRSDVSGIARPSRAPSERARQIAGALQSAERKVGPSARICLAAMHGLSEPLALAALLACALVRLNSFTLGYVALVGWVRAGFLCPRLHRALVRVRGRCGGCGLASWLGVSCGRRARVRPGWLAICVWLVVSIGTQYLAILSPLPPSVWHAPNRRPWSRWGASWEAAAGACQRTASQATAAVASDFAAGNQSSSVNLSSTAAAAPPSDAMCYLGLDGHVPTARLALDVCTLMLCAWCTFGAPRAPSRTLGGLVGRSQRTVVGKALAALEQARHSSQGQPRYWQQLGNAVIALVDGTLRNSHRLVLILCVCLGTTTSIGAPLVTGWLQMVQAMVAAFLLCNERDLVRHGGWRWERLHLCAFLSLAMLALYQAPLVPLTCSQYEVADSDSALDVGSTWCSLAMASLGLSKLRIGEGTDDRTTARHASTAFPLLLLWLLVDIQASLFCHPCFAERVTLRLRKLEATARAVQLHDEARQHQLRLLHVAKLAAWTQYAVLSFKRLEARIDEIEQLLHAEKVRARAPHHLGPHSQAATKCAGAPTRQRGSVRPRSGVGGGGAVPLRSSSNRSSEFNGQCCEESISCRSDESSQRLSTHMSGGDDHDDDDNESDDDEDASLLAPSLATNRQSVAAEDSAEWLREQRHARIRRIRQNDSLLCAVEDLQTVVGGTKEQCEAALLLCGAGSKDLEWLGAGASFESRALMCALLPSPGCMCSLKALQPDCTTQRTSTYLPPSRPEPLTRYLCLCARSVRALCAYSQQQSHAHDAALRVSRSQSTA